MSGMERFADNRSGAVLSDDREYRYQLRRCWDVRKPILAFIMLNPSTADETDDDPTVRRCLGYAQDWGYGALLVGNLFALRTSDPALLGEHDDPIGPKNDAWLAKIVEKADRVVAAWGANGELVDRGREVAGRFDDLYALGTTKDGHPVHPLYQPADAEAALYATDLERDDNA